MIRPFLIIIISVFTLTAATPAAAASDRVQGVRIFLHQGNPDEAIKSAHILLAASDLKETDRQALLELIAEAEELKAAAGHYQNVRPALAALDTLIKEFPDSIEESKVLWRMALLHWKSGNKNNALASARELTDRFGNSDDALRAWLLMARIHLEQNKFEKARTDLIQRGIRVAEGSRDQALNNGWMAVVDDAESRDEQAWKVIEPAYRAYPDAIEGEEQLFALFIRLQYRFGDRAEALAHAETFLKKYVTGNFAPEIRLLHADMRAELKRGDRLSVQNEYEKIAIAAAETTVGKKAFMRKMMLQYHDNGDYATLKPVIIALKRIAGQNQLSDVENESMLYQARLWIRVAENDPEHAPEQAGVAALEDYARVAVSAYPDLAALAKTEGKSAYIKYIEMLIANKKWMQVVVAWERFPQLRPAAKSTAQLRFGVAHALRMLMEYEQSEALLKELYAEAAGSVWGHKVMLERARLWLDRGDADGVSRVMAWLSDNEFTLYRPEMLLLVARMQLKAGNAAKAAQTIVNVAASDVAIEERGNYWRARADIAEKMERWHVAAYAWQKYGTSRGADETLAQLNQANALFKAEEYSKAEKLYAGLPEQARDAAWEYRYSICQIRSGKRLQGMERLEELKSDKGAGIYASMAALELAERKADELMEQSR